MKGFQLVKALREIASDTRIEYRAQVLFDAANELEGLINTNKQACDLAERIRWLAWAGDAAKEAGKVPYLISDGDWLRLVNQANQRAAKGEV